MCVKRMLYCPGSGQELLSALEVTYLYPYFAIHLYPSKIIDLTVESSYICKQLQPEIVLKFFIMLNLGYGPSIFLYIFVYLQFVVHMLRLRHSESFLQFSGDLSSVNSRIRRSTQKMRQSDTLVCEAVSEFGTCNHVM